tara:strand:+ start:167 stop:664 length:498 start_codon:yes stop_codon:yes gene_type:complete
MKNVLLVFVISIFIFLILSYFLKDKKVSNENDSTIIASQIKFEELGGVIDNSIGNKLEYDFFGITSNGIDCIYFVMDGPVINIDFEIMIEEQLQYIERFKYYANRNDYQLKEITYGNKPKYGDSKEAPVYKMIINGDKTSAEEIGIEIQKEVFKNDNSTNFEIVP